MMAALPVLLLAIICQICCMKSLTDAKRRESENALSAEDIFGAAGRTVRINPRFELPPAREELHDADDFLISTESTDTNRLFRYWGINE